MDEDDCMPFELDFFDESENFRTQFRRIFERIQNVGRLTTDYWRRCLIEDETFNAKVDAAEEQGVAMEETPYSFVATGRVQARLTELFEAWQLTLIGNMESMREIRHYSLKVAHFGEDEHGHPKKLKNTLGMHVFFEMTRIFGLINRPRLLEELDTIATTPLDALDKENYDMFLSLSQTKHPIWISIFGTFDISAMYKEKEAKDDDVEAVLLKIKGMWSKPIMDYAQSEVRLIIFFLTQQLNDIPTLVPEVMIEFRRVFNVVWLRISNLFQELYFDNILDEEDMRVLHDQELGVYSINRQFTAFCTFYMSELLRRFFYYDKLINNVMLDDEKPDPSAISALSNSTFQWLTRVVETFADEAFDDLYTNNSAEGYQFVGDDAWFKFAWPARIHSRGACINELRPHLSKRFYSDGQVNKRIVLTIARSSHVARIFIFKAVDEYIKMKVPNTHWINGVVVSNNGIEMSAHALQSDRAPLLLQVFSTYWVYDNGRVHVCDDVYEAVGMWFWLLHTRHGDVLYDCNLSEFSKAILEPIGLYTETREQREGPRNQQQREKQGRRLLDLEHVQVARFEL